MMFMARSHHVGRFHAVVAERGELPEESDASTATAYGVMREHGCGHRYLVNVGASLPDPMTVTAPFSPSFVAAKLNALLIVLPAHELLMARSGKPASTASARYSYALMVSALSIVFCLLRP